MTDNKTIRPGKLLSPEFTALDAVQLGFKTHFIGDASRGDKISPGDVTASIEEMKLAGVRVGQSVDLVKNI